MTSNTNQYFRLGVRVGIIQAQSLAAALGYKKGQLVFQGEDNSRCILAFQRNPSWEYFDFNLKLGLSPGSHSQGSIKTDGLTIEMRIGDDMTGQLSKLIGFT